MSQFSSMHLNYSIECANFYLRSDGGNIAINLGDLVNEKWDIISPSLLYQPDCEFKYLSGDYETIIIKNEKRFQLKRIGQEIKSLKMELNSNDFNFTQISDCEILCYLHFSESKLMLLTANIYPIFHQHMLLIPQPSLRLPQWCQFDSLVQVITICFNSRPDQNIAIGFNSLGALASVNHCHYHVFFDFSQKIPIKYFLQHKLHKRQCIYLVSSYITPFFLFVVTSMSETTCIRKSYEFMNYLQCNNLSYNFCMFQDLISSISDSHQILLCIFPKKPLLGVKNYSIPYGCCFEIAGIFAVKDLKTFKEISENDIKIGIKNHSFSQSECLNLASILFSDEKIIII